MELISLGGGDLFSSRLAYGCMRIAGDGSPRSVERGRSAVRAAIEEGYTHFDHADIYGKGRCEELFADVLDDLPGIRDELVITSKCGVRFPGDPDGDAPGRYDLTRQQMLESVEGSLRRLRIDRLDLLLLHRPDYLLDAGEVAETFRQLHASGKVAHFGVSNFSPSQVSLLQSATDHHLLVNQVEINIHRIDAMVDGTLDQCRQLRITPQSWCPLGGVAYPAWGNSFTPEDERRIGHELERQASRYGVEDWVVVLAWLLKHPSGIVPIIGTTKASRIRAAKQALKLEYSREDWYRLLEARNGRAVP